MTIHCSGRITIIEIPDGEAPEWVRKEWIGLILPIVGMTTSEGRGVITGKKSDTDEAYMVLQVDAISVLSESVSAKSAVRWFNDRGYPQEDSSCFGFKVRQCRAVGELTVSPMKVHVGLEEVGVGAHDHPANQRQ